MLPLFIRSEREYCVARDLLTQTANEARPDQSTEVRRSWLRDAIKRWEAGAAQMQGARSHAYQVEHQAWSAAFRSVSRQVAASSPELQLHDYD